jgi:hypothetical protein
MTAQKITEKVIVRPDGKIKVSLLLDPQVYGMLIEYKRRKGTQSTLPSESINVILNDFLLERLTKPSTFASIRSLDKFDKMDLEPGK